MRAGGAQQHPVAGADPCSAKPAAAAAISSASCGKWRRSRRAEVPKVTDACCWWACAAMASGRVAGRVVSGRALSWPVRGWLVFGE
ncbi:hypothetical protein GXW82_32305 [Streptacidiphilus sp. 4-A2]|nr:hypothetical protein [Streptacidiphilus sp. 4-A2]